jgi:hypothetical protein
MRSAMQAGNPDKEKDAAASKEGAEPGRSAASSAKAGKSAAKRSAKPKEAAAKSKAKRSGAKAAKRSSKAGKAAAEPSPEPAAPAGPEQAAAKPADSDGERRRRALLLGGAALVVLAALIVWLATRGGGGEAEPTGGGFEAKIVSEAELEGIAASSGHLVYWVGPRPGKQLEASESPDGDVRVRYLDKGAEPGSDQTGALAIGSYPLANATSAVEGFGEREGAIVRNAPDGREVVSSVAAPSSAYFASPDGKVQVEVYDPSPKRAMGVALSGNVHPLG